MLLSILGVLFVSLICAIIAWYIFYFKYEKYLKNVNGPTPLPLVGNALEFKSRNTTLQTFAKLFKEHGKIVKLFLGIEPVIIIADYKAVESVLGSNKILTKATFYRFLFKWLNFGLLTSTGNKWKQRRRILTPTYHFKILEQFVPIFNNVSNILVEELTKEKNKDCVDVYPYITLSTLDVICETAMGVPVNAQRNKDSAYVTSVKEMGRILMDRTFHPNQQIEFLYKFTKNYQMEKECLDILHGHTMSVIRKRKEELSRNVDDEKGNEDEFGTKKRIAFLDMLLQCTDENGKPLSDEDIREEVDTFMFEGHDTTASGISFALFEIANNPDVQQKILDEQKEILNGEERDFNFNDLNQMRYLEMVIKEALRLYPSVPMFGRKATEDFKLTDDITVPAGMNITVVVYQIHRDPEYFPNPEKFDPDRYLPERNLGKSPYSYVPFSAGPRNCIGQKFAFLEMKMTLSKVVKHFELLPTTPVHKLDVTSETILKSDNGILIKIRKRQ